MERAALQVYVYHTEGGHDLDEIREAMVCVPDHSLTQSSVNNIEIMPANVNKGTGLRDLAERFNIKPENILAMGDQLNDLPMLAYAGISVAMGNDAGRERHRHTFNRHQHRSWGGGSDRKILFISQTICQLAIARGRIARGDGGVARGAVQNLLDQAVTIRLTHHQGDAYLIGEILSTSVTGRWLNR